MIVVVISLPGSFGCFAAPCPDCAQRRLLPGQSLDDPPCFEDNHCDDDDEHGNVVNQGAGNDDNNRAHHCLAMIILLRRMAMLTNMTMTMGILLNSPKITLKSAMSEKIPNNSKTCS